MVAFRAAELTELATSFRLEAGACLAEGRTKEACVALRAALKLAPGDQEAQTLMGEAARPPCNRSDAVSSRLTHTFYLGVSALPLLRVYAASTPLLRQAGKERFLRRCPFPNRHSTLYERRSARR